MLNQLKVLKSGETDTLTVYGILGQDILRHPS